MGELGFMTRVTFRQIMTRRLSINQRHNYEMAEGVETHACNINYACVETSVMYLRAKKKDNEMQINKNIYIKQTYLHPGIIQPFL